MRNAEPAPAVRLELGDGSSLMRLREGRMLMARRSRPAQRGRRGATVRATHLHQHRTQPFALLFDGSRAARRAEKSDLNALGERLQEIKADVLSTMQLGVQHIAQRHGLLFDVGSRCNVPHG